MNLMIESIDLVFAATLRLSPQARMLFSGGPNKHMRA